MSCFLRIVTVILSYVLWNYRARCLVQARVCEWLIDVAGLGIEHMQPDQDGNTPAEMARMEGFHELSNWLGRAANVPESDRATAVAADSVGIQQ